MNSLLKLALLSITMLPSVVAMEQQNPAEQKDLKQEALQRIMNRLQEVQNPKPIGITFTIETYKSEDVRNDFFNDLLSLNLSDLEYTELFQNAASKPNIAKALTNALNNQRILNHLTNINRIKKSNKATDIKFTTGCKIKEISSPIVTDEIMTDLLKTDLSKLENINFSGKSGEENRNPFSTGAAMALASAIKTNKIPKLNYLDLEYCSINYEGLEAIVDVIIKKQEDPQFCMNFLNLTGNNITTPQKAGLEEKLRKTVEESNGRLPGKFYYFDY